MKSEYKYPNNYIYVVGGKIDFLMKIDKKQELINMIGCNKKNKL